MMIIDPKMTSPTTKTPKARDRMLLVESGAVLMCKKKTKCTPICAIARTARSTGMLGPQTELEEEAAKDAAVSNIASPRPSV
jgi:hypothetical protein